MKVNIRPKEKKRPRKEKAFSSEGFSLNRSFQTKPQSYRVTQKEGSEELSSHNAAPRGPLSFRLAQQGAIKDPRCPRQVCETRYCPGGTSRWCFHWWTKRVQKPLTCASLLTNFRSSAHPQKMFVLWMGFFKSVAKQGQASPVPRVPRTQSSALCCVKPQGSKSSPCGMFCSGAYWLKPNPCLGGGEDTRVSETGKQGRVPTRQTQTPWHSILGKACHPSWKPDKWVF